MDTLTHDHRARLVLMRATDPPAPAVHAFVLEHGALAALRSVLYDEAPDAVNAELRRPDMEAQRDLDVIQSGRARFLTPEDDEWPAQLVDAARRGDFTPPLGLWVRGHARLDEIHATLAIIGGRHPSHRGDQLAAAFARTHAAHRTSIVTAADRGVAATALDAVFDPNVPAPAPPIVILPGGLDIPLHDGFSHLHLYRSVPEEGGLLISEHPVGTRSGGFRPWTRARRLAAALANATLAVEAPANSPSLRPARFARALGRPVYAIPGPGDCVHAIGVNRLLESDVATPAVEPLDIPPDAVAGRTSSHSSPIPLTPPAPVTPPLSAAAIH